MLEVTGCSNMFKCFLSVPYEAKLLQWNLDKRSPLGSGKICSLAVYWSLSRNAKQCGKRLLKSQLASRLESYRRWSNKRFDWIIENWDPGYRPTSREKRNQTGVISANVVPVDAILRMTMPDFWETKTAGMPGSAFPSGLAIIIRAS